MRYGKSLAAALVLGIVLGGTTAQAGEAKIVGVINAIEMAGQDAKTATVVLKDNGSDQSVTVVVSDDLTLDKFKDHRIVQGDEIRCKYEQKDGKNVSTLFRKTAGC